MKKKNNFKGFYEDEESLKMLEIINESADKEYARIRKVEKRAKTESILIKVFVITSLLFMAGCVLYVSGLKYQNNVNKCVASGESQASCEYKFSK